MIKGILGIILGLTALISAGFSSLSHLQDFSNTPTNQLPNKTILPVVLQKEIPKENTPSAPSPRAATNTQKIIVIKDKPRSVKMVASPVTTNGSLVPQQTISESAIITPGPLVAIAPVKPSSSWTLSIKGVIEYTNGARSQNGGLPALIENEVLDHDAKMKLDDMFARQYFEHVSPAGVGPADLAASVGYAYIIVGENLALGDFGSDEKLVTAWMNSPGHRANILNSHYQEIGVAVGKGKYLGRETWLAVQSFGMPLSACPQIDTQTKIQIENNNVQITNQRAQIESRKTRIDNTAIDDPNYNNYVTEYNNLLPPYNSLIESTRALIANYNAGVQAYNNCVNSASVH